jgi:molybdate transport system substrate-binding protein
VVKRAGSAFLAAPAARIPLAVLAVLMVAVAGCDAEPVRPAPVAGEITVYADASMTGAFTAIGRAFERRHPGTKVALTFRGSGALARQLVQGARADVFAAADAATMRQVTGAGEATTFARNQIVIAVPEGNPRVVSGPADLTRRGVRVALCVATEPCGAAARLAFAAAGASITPAAEVPDVTAALTALERGDVHAAFVYRTDARAAKSQVDAVEFPESAQAVGDDVIAVLKDAPNLATAQAFVAFVLSPEGTAILAGAGFKRP